jgi:hypothetical protein
LDGLTLPAPPAVLPARPRFHELPPGSLLVRFYDPARGSWAQHRAFGPLPHARFDHHLPPPGTSSDRSIWYAATSLVGALAEAFGDLGLVDRGAGRRVCVVRVEKPVPLLDLVGVGPRVFALDQRLATSRNSASCQEWARAFYAAYPAIRGLRWRGRQAGSICCAFNDRLEPACLTLDADYDLGHAAVWPRIARAAHRCRLRIVAP